MADTKRPTAQDIENADNAVRLLLGSLVTGALKNPATRAENTMAAIRTWAPVLDIIAYAAACVEAEAIGADWGNFARLRADRAGKTPPPPPLADLVAQRDSVDQQIRTLYAKAEAERVPSSIVEHYGVGPEDDPDSGQRVVELTWRGWWLGDEAHSIYGYVFPGGKWGYYKGGGFSLTKTGAAPTEAAARIAVEACLPPHCKVTNPGTPEDARDGGWIAWEGGECPVHPGDVVEYEMRSGVRRVSVARRLWWKRFMDGGDIVRYRLAQTEQPDPPEQPPTDPEARVRAMSDEEVEAGLTERGVGAWERHGRHAGTHRRTHLERGFTVITTAGRPFMSVLSGYGERGDTTTPEGRAECSRRLLVHLMRAEG